MAHRFFHIVDGDCTAGTLRQAGFLKDGDILSWRDALFSGPVPRLSLRQLSRLRSRFWTNGRRTTEFDKRDSKLVQYPQYGEIVLWFSSDCTLCELSLIQLISWFQEQKKRPAQLSWVPEHGGVLKPEQISGPHAARKVVTAPQIRAAMRVWKAFRSSSPALLNRLLDSDMHVLPGIRNTIRWILQEYPGTRDGLSRLQRKLLRGIGSRGSTKIASVVMSVLATETVGDMFLLDLVEGCAMAEHPLVRVDPPFGNRRKAHFKYRSQVSITDTGRRVLAGKADHIALNGIDRWLGGVHLSGNQVRWRWDERGQRIISSR
jgi:hypothetical protein